MKAKDFLLYMVIGITVLFAIVPMQLSPYHNGKIPKHRDQYEKMTDAIMEGHLYLDEKVDDKLLELENPYDPKPRKDSGADFKWDHAFYKGRYYMYFGVVPVFTVFIPYRLITGLKLVTFQATQVFTAFFILGLFWLFRLLRKLFFNKMPFSVFLMLSVGFSMISVWHIVSIPALYCTAIASGICYAVWSLFFFMKSVYDSKKESEELIYLTLGSLCGALVFGCRPPIAMFNVILLPVLYLLIKKREFNKKRAFKLLATLLPYVIIGVLLMIYNYLRFDNPFEFGQSYQLTLADQHEYSLLKNFSIINILYCIYYLNFEIQFETILNRGIFISFPIFFVGLAGIFNKKVRQSLKKNNLSLMVLFMLIGLLLIMISLVLYSPYVILRYRMDITWLLSIITFILIGFLYNYVKQKKVFRGVLIVLSILMIVMSVLLFLKPYDLNLTSYIRIIWG